MKNEKNFPWGLFSYMFLNKKNNRGGVVVSSFELQLLRNYLSHQHTVFGIFIVLISSTISRRKTRYIHYFCNCQTIAQSMMTSQRSQCDVIYHQNVWLFKLVILVRFDQNWNNTTYVMIIQRLNSTFRGVVGQEAIDKWRHSCERLWTRPVRERG